MAQVMTVRGPVDSSELGVTLTHEHIIIDQMREARSDGLLNDLGLMASEITALRALGCGTVVDCTSIGLGRDVVSLARISEQTGINIIAGTGFYRHPYLDRDWFDEHGVDYIADHILREIEEGIDGTGIRPGIIGEVGCDRFISAAEERSFRAAARAQIKSRLTLSTHAARWPVGDPQLDLLEEEGVDPYRVVVGHCDRVNDRDYHLRIAKRGAWVQFDTIRPLSEYDIELRLGFIRAMADAGFLDRVLLSQDVCMRSHLLAYGGGGYGYILTTFTERLKAEGFTDADIEMIFVSNPRRALTGEA